MIVGSVIGISGLGALSNEVSLDVQNLGVFPSVEDFQGGFGCLCDGVACNYDPYNLEEEHAHMLCNWETHVMGFGSQITTQVYHEEGCSADFWSTYNEDEWPEDYDPDYKYNEIFSTTYFYDDVYSQQGKIGRAHV